MATLLELAAVTAPDPVAPEAAEIPLQDASEALLDDLRYMRGASPYTLSDYRDDIRLFIRFVEAEVHPGRAASLSDLTLGVMRAFVVWCAKSGRAAKSIAHYVTTLRTLCRFLVDQGVLTYNPAMSVRGPKVASTKAEPITDEELSAFFSAIPGTREGPRYRVFFGFLLATGLRIGEAVAVGTADADLSGRMLWVRCDKGQKDRMVPLAQGTADELGGYLRDLRHAPGTAADAPFLWLTRTGHRLAKSSVRTVLDGYCKRAGLDPCRLHPHAWRATFASRMARAGVAVTVIQELMGHANVNTTAHYVGTAPQAMRAAVERVAESGESGARA